MYVDQILQYMFGTISLALLKGKFKTNTSKWKPLPSEGDQEEAIRGTQGYWQIYPYTLKFDTVCCHSRSKSHLRKATYLTQCGTV